MNAKNAGSQLEEKKVKKKRGSVPAPIVDTTQPSPKTEPAKHKKEVKAKGFQLDPKLVAMAKQFGIPLEQIIKYAEMQDARITQLETAIESLGVSLQPVMDLATRIQEAQANQPMPTASSNPMPTAGGGMGALMQFLPMLMGGGGGESELSKELMRMSIDRMKADIGFTEAIKTAIVSKLAGKAAASLV